MSDAQIIRAAIAHYRRDVGPHALEIDPAACSVRHAPEPHVILRERGRKGHLGKLVTVYTVRGGRFTPRPLAEVRS